MRAFTKTVVAFTVMVAIVAASQEVAEVPNPPDTTSMPPGRAEFVNAVDQLYLEANVSAGAAFLQQSVAKGYAQAYPLLALCYQYGIGVPQSDAKATLYHHFGALAGSIDSNLALAYRYQHGISVPKSCNKAVEYARYAAGHVAKTYTSDIKPVVNAVKLSELTTNSNSNDKNNKETLQMHEFRADKGVVASLVFLGYAHMLGARGVTQDGHAAKTFFEEAIEKGEAAGYGGLGQLYANGMSTATPPIEKNIDMALAHFTAGAKRDHQVSLNGLGYLYAKGDGVEQSFARAAEYFEQSAAQGNAEGLYNTGVLYLNGKGVKKDLHKAVGLFAKAAAAGSVLAHWQLGALNLKGVGGLAVSCSAAMRHYRMVLERAPWKQRISTAASEYLDGDYTAALLDYLQAGEVGMSIGRVNAAYILERNVGSEDLDLRGGNTTVSGDDLRLQILHQLILRSAHEGDVEAHLKLGDHYYYGIATPVDYDKAEEHYNIAAASGNAQALFNLGYMRQRGLGTVAKDFHLAKRYYDSTLSADSAAHYLVQAALIGLNFDWWVEYYSQQPGGLMGALVPAPYSIPLDDVILGLFTGLAIMLLLLRNHAIAMANQ